MVDHRLVALLLLALGSPAEAAPTPDYATVRNRVTVDAPVERAWARIGSWCAIATWLNVTCEETPGAGAAGAGDVGAVRRLNGTTLEAMVARSAHGYSYWQTQGNMAGYGYHGTLAAEAAGAARTTLTYTLFYDQAAMPSDAVRASERARLNARFAAALATMKRLAEQP